MKAGIVVDDINTADPEGLSYPARRGGEVVGRVLDRTPYPEVGTVPNNAYVFEAQAGPGPPWAPGPRFPRFDLAEAALGEICPAPAPVPLSSLTPAAPKRKPTRRTKPRIPMKE